MAPQGAANGGARWSATVAAASSEWRGMALRCTIPPPASTVRRPRTLRGSLQRREGQMPLLLLQHRATAPAQKHKAQDARQQGQILRPEHQCGRAARPGAKHGDSCWRKVAVIANGNAKLIIRWQSPAGHLERLHTTVAPRYGGPTGVRTAIRADWGPWWPARAIPCPRWASRQACAGSLPPAAIEGCERGRFSHPLKAAIAAGECAAPAGTQGSRRWQPYAPPCLGRWKNRGNDRRSHVGALLYVSHITVR